MWRADESQKPACIRLFGDGARAAFVTFIRPRDHRLEMEVHPMSGQDFGNWSGDEFAPPDDIDMDVTAATSSRHTLIDIIIEVRAALALNKEALADLELARQHHAAKPTSALARQVLIAAATGLAYPLIEYPADYRDLEQQAASGRLNRHAARGLVMIEMEVSALVCADAALVVLDAFGEPVQPAWSNQPLSYLARAITRYQHLLTKRIPGLAV